jgi:hypothetical protein
MCWIIEKVVKNSFEMKLVKKMSSLKIPSKNVPKEIREWVKEVFEGKDLREYSLTQGKDVVADMPWHEADRQYYKMFKLLPEGKAQETDFEFQRSGLEGDGSVTGKEVGGRTKVPSGFVIVVVGVYPKRAEIYTSDDAQMFLPKKDVELSDEEIMVLYWARSLISSARPVFKDKKFYEKLIEKNLLKKNKAISLEGKNILEDATIKERLKTIRSKDFEDKLEESI